MRRFLTGVLFVLVVVLLVVPTAMGRLLARSAAPVADQVEHSDSLSIAVYFPETKQVRNMPLGEYLKGVVAAEMPREFADEALKAQFIVARTYAVYRMQALNGPGRAGCPAEPTADVCADPKTGQAYVSREASLAAEGAGAESFWRRLDALQVATDGLVLMYEGKTIDPLYHAVSGTMTEDAADYFEHAKPYLKPADDTWGKDAKNLTVTVRFSPEKLAQGLSGAGKQVAVPAVASSVTAGKAPVQILSRTATGRVRSVKVAGVTLTGREFRERLGLRSTNFTVGVEKGQVMITTTGNGHGVGMSQWGANGMARAGKTHAEILAHYYQGTTLTMLFDE